MLLTGLLFVLLLLDGSAHADTVPGAVTKQGYYKFQYAGNVGFVAAGLGREFSRRFSADISLGYLSKEINGARVFTFSFRPA